MEIVASVDDGSARPRAYIDDEGTPREFHITDLEEFEGLECRYFDSVSECIDYYYTKTKDLLYYKSAPASSVFTSVLSNIGESKGQGLEIGVNALAARSLGQGNARRQAAPPEMHSS